jgi:peptidoglycan-associated lipoprotein
MSKKAPVWLVVIFSVIAFGLVSSGCAKKQVVKEETGVKPVMETKKEAAKPEAPKVVEEPKKEPEAAPPAPAPVPAAPPQEAKVEAAPPAPAPTALDLKLLTIRFAFDDYSLSQKSKENLEQIASWMSKNPGTKVQIQGNTCDIGTAEYNLALGEQRANSAKKYLEGLGVSAGRLATVSYGLEKPAVPNKDEENRRQNRRDDFVAIK